MHLQTGSGGRTYWITVGACRCLCAWAAALDAALRVRKACTIAAMRPGRPWHRPDGRPHRIDISNVDGVARLDAAGAQRRPEARRQLQQLAAGDARPAACSMAQKEPLRTRAVPVALVEPLL